MAEEYKRKWHEHHDPRADNKQYIGTKILDAIEKAAIDTYQDERTLEGWEWANPISVGTAGAIRTVEGVGTVLANTPVVAQGLQAYGKVADVAAGNVGSLVATTGLDPRFGGWAVRLAEAWYGGQAISAASKSKYARAAGKFAKIQADEVGMKASMLTKKKHGKVWKNPKAGVEPDPWFAKDDVGGPKKTYERFQKRRAYGPEYGTENPMWMDPKEIARRHDMKMSLFNYIDSTSDVPVPRNPTFGEMLNIKQNLPIVADAKVRSSHVKKLKKLKLGELGSIFQRDVLTRTSKKTGLGQLTRGEAQTISNESVKHFTKRAPERVPMINELRSFYSNLTDKQIIPNLDHKNPLKLSAYLMDGQDLAGRRNIRKIIFDESGLYTGDDARNFQALPREVHKVWTDNMNRVMGVELEKFIGEMVEKGITDRTKIAKIYAKRVRAQRNKFDKAYEAHKIVHGIRRNPITGEDIIDKPENIATVLTELVNIDIENWGPTQIRDFYRSALRDYNLRDPLRIKDLGDEAIRKKMQNTYESIWALNQQLDTLDLSDDAIKAKLNRLKYLNKKFKKLEDKLYTGGN